MKTVTIQATWELAGKTALVTGAAKRMGRAIALALAGNGVNMVLHYRSSGDEVGELAGAIRKLGVQAWTVAADLALPAAADSLFDQAVVAAGPVDVLVNNASSFPLAQLWDIETPDVVRAIQVNALSPFALARKFAAQGREGAVVNLLDARMVDYDKEHVGYLLSKRMLFSLTQMMAIEFAPAVRVNSVAPGLILPPEGQTADYLERLVTTNPLNRHGDPADVASAVLFLLSSRFITGQVIFVDGGRHLRGSMYGC